MNRLYNKILGCIAGSQVGSALGDPVENWHYEKIQQVYGVVDHLIGDENRPPGKTEDGVERQKLMILSITEKKGPITARDLALTWLKYVKEESFGKLAGQQDEIHYEELRHEFYKVYKADGLPFAKSRAYEVTSKGIALFHFYQGDVKETMIAAVNFGRDTDCLASVSAGIAGAFSGSSNIPSEWIAQVNEATKLNEFTVTQKTIEELCDGLYEAVMAHHRSMRNSVYHLEALME